MYDKELREVRDKLESLDQQRLEEGDRTKDFTIHLSTTANEIKFLERDLKELEIKVTPQIFNIYVKLFQYGSKISFILIIC